jgi:hypothetical protein
MLSAFWSGLGGEFAKQWVTRILTPAFAFWAGGLAAVWWHSHGRDVRARGWSHELSATSAWVRQLPGVVQGVIIVAALLLVVVSAVAAERLTQPLLRLLEGYGWHPQWLRDQLIRYRRRRYHRWDKRVADLAKRQQLGGLTDPEFFELKELEKAGPAADPLRLQQLQKRRTAGFDARMMGKLGHGRSLLRAMPRQDALGMPTRLGDILRAAERRPADKYGLDAVVCWPALWLLLPAEAKTELVQARSALDNAARTWLWGALFVVWTPWTWLALPVAIAVPALAYYVSVLAAAAAFGELTVTAFDLYRFQLYDSLHLPRPTSPDTERSRDGMRVTRLLWAGLDEPGLQYVGPPAAGEAGGEDGAQARPAPSGNPLLRILARMRGGRRG